MSTWTKVISPDGREYFVDDTRCWTSGPVPTAGSNSFVPYTIESLNALRNGIWNERTPLGIALRDAMWDGSTPAQPTGRFRNLDWDEVS